jgi:predicted Zn-dependent protease
MQAKQAYISGSLGVALYLNERDQTMILDLKTPDVPREPRRNEVNFFFNVALHYRAQNPNLKPVSLDVLREDLRVENLNFTAFDNMHIGMDRHLPTGLREKAICKANMLIRENVHVNTYVKHHFLFPLNSQEWDVKGAGELAEKLDKPFALKYYTLFNSYTVDNVYESAILIAKEQFNSVFEQKQAMDDFFHSGLLGDLVEAVGEKNSAFIHGLIFSASKYQGFSNQAGKKFVTSLVNKHKHETKTSSVVLEVSKPKQDQLLSIIEAYLAKENAPVKRGKKPRHEEANPNTFKLFEAVKSQIAKIEILLNNNKIADAKNLTNQLVKQQLENSDKVHVTKTLTQIAYFALNVNALDFVETLIEAVELLGAEDATFFNIKASFLSVSGRKLEALAVFEETMHRFPHNEVARVAYAELLRDLGRKDEALNVFEETMHRFPQDEVARNAYAELLREMGRKDEALNVFEETMHRFPHNEVARNAYAELLRDLGRKDEALNVFEETMHRFPHNEVARNAYAELLREMGRKDEALTVFEETMHRFTQDEVARNAYAELLREMGRKDQALTVFEQTMRRFPHNEVARRAKAHLLIELNRYDEAKKLLERDAISPRTKDEWVGFHILAMAELKQKNYAKALEKFDYGIKNCTIQTSKSYFETAYALCNIRAKEFENAKQAIQDAIIHAKPQEKMTLKLLNIQSDIGLKTKGFNPKFEGIDITQHGDAAQKQLLKLLIEQHGFISDKKPYDITKYQANEVKIIELEDNLVFGAMMRDLNKPTYKPNFQM